MLGRIKRLAGGDGRVRGRRPRVESLERRDLLATFIVSNPADSGANTLREAITRANADTSADGDTINFQIGTGTQTITLASPLPTITGRVTIDATTQPRAANQAGSVAPRIVLDGAGAGAGANGLVLSGPGGSAVRGLAIVNFAAGANGGGRGILATDAGGDTFAANYLGMDPDGTTIRSNAVGVELRSPNNTVGAPHNGTATDTINLISGNTSAGVLIAGATATGNRVIGNFIGTNAAGTLAASNGNGVTISSASNNTVGGLGASSGNLISGNIGPNRNDGAGVLLIGTSSGNSIAGNRIGTDVTGTKALGNSYGIAAGPTTGATAADSIRNTTIGGVDAGTLNQISGNGIGIAGTMTTSLIAGNLIGTDQTGNQALPNGQGIFLNANGTVIGGTTATTRNVISGNGLPQLSGYGLELFGDSNLVLGNFVGTNSAGTAALPNTIGMSLHTTNATIGGTDEGAGNLVAGNTGDGIVLDGNPGNRFYGNTIGNGAIASLGNKGNGIEIVVPTSGTTTGGVAILNDTIGDPAPGGGNVIAGNGGSGIALTNAGGATVSGLLIRSNSIANNGALGISLGADRGVPTAGYTAITSATTTASGSEIIGVVGGRPGAVLIVDLYANAAADPSGYGEGQIPLGATQVTVGPGGFAPFRYSFAGPLGQNPAITATASDQSTKTTTEFSAAFPNALATTDLAITQAVSAQTIAIGGIVTLTSTVTNNGTTAARGVVFSDALGGNIINAVTTTSLGTVAPLTGNIAQVVIGDLNPGQSATITITANAASNTLGNTTVSNTAGVVSLTPDANYANNSATQSFVIGTAARPTADLAIAASPSTASPAAGTNLVYTITVSNAGPNDATGVVVSDFLPSGATFVGATSSQGTANSQLRGNLLTSDLGTIAAGASATLTITVTPTVAGTISNTASVMSNLLDPTPGNNSATTTSTVTGTTVAPTLALSQVVSPSSIAPGQPATITITVRNTGTVTAPGVILVDTLPNGLASASGTASQGETPTVSGSVVTANLGTIAAGASATLTLVIVPNGSVTALNNFAGVIASGAPTATPIFSNATLNVAGATAAGPSVTGVAGSRSNAQLVVGFSGPITPASATTKANYLLYALGTTPRAVTANDRPIAITTAVYNSATNSVSLTPSRSLASTQYYALVVVGNTARGITDTSGRKLVGTAGGAAGTNYTTTFRAGQLVQV